MDEEDNVVCNWMTYKGNHCRKNTLKNGKTSCKYCLMHKEIINDYKKVKKSDELCETFKEIKMIPRSHKHIKHIMASMDNDDDIVQVYMSGGLIEDADISHELYILLLSDNSKFYYNGKRGQLKAKNLKIVLRKYCQNNSCVDVRGSLYCEECYKKLGNVPRLNLVS